MNKIKTSLTAGLCLLSVACSTTTTENEPQNYQTFQISSGIEASMQPPVGFNITQEHYGFVQPASFSRIELKEIEIPYPTYLQALTKENLLKTKLRLVKQEEIEVNKANCTLLTLRQLIAGTYYEKLWLIAGDKLSSIQVEASYPEGISNTQKQAIKESLMSLSVETNTNSRLYTGLPFYLNATPNFTIKQRHANSIVLADSEQPSNIVVISHGKLAQQVENIQTISEHFLKNSKSLSEVEITKNEMIKLNDIPALSTQAYAINGDEMHWVYQVVSSQKSKFLLVQATSPKAERKTFAVKLEQLLGEFKFK